MIIKRLIIENGIEKSDDKFSSTSNLIKSDENSKGKSTLLRILFYSLGYQIPDMKGLDFSKFNTKLYITEKDKEYVLTRNSNFIKIENKDVTISYHLPDEHNSLLSYIFEYEKINVLKNLLGIIYIDQEKGWTLLNRGTVIGRNKFNIEELLLGLKDLDYSKLLAERDRILKEQQKYKSLIDINELKKQVLAENKEIYISDFEQEINSKISLINIKINNIQYSINEIDDVLKKDRQFFNYIESMNLEVEKTIENKKITIPVNKKTLKWSEESYDFMKARKSLLINDLHNKKNELSKYNNILENYYNNNTIITNLSNENNENLINKKLSDFYIDQEMLQSFINKNAKKLKYINKSLKKTITDNNKFIEQIYSNIKKYAKFLNVDEKMTTKEDFIFTSDLKSMSGAILQKMVFAFKLSFLKVIEKEMGIKLFMVLDSPKSKELDEKNTKLITDLINSELKDNQVFIASIYDFDCDKIIKIKNQAIEIR